MDRSIIDDGLFRKIVFVSVILVLASAGSVGAVTNISSCGTISSSGVYELIQNITNSGTCITIESSNVVFDGQEYTINGTKIPGTYGIYVYNGSTTLTNVTVKNTIVTEWNNSILYENVENGTITGNTVSYNKEDGIGLYSSSDNTITGNNAFKNDYGGIYLGNSTGNTITDNNASYNKREGIFLEVFSNYNTITNNTITGNSMSTWSDGGIALRESTDNTIKDNTVSDDGDNGIALYSSSSNTITGNTASSNSYGGIYLYNSSSNTITGNTLSNNEEDGIVLYSSSSNTITGNTAFSNNYGGIYLYNSSSNTITGNTLSNNEEDGIALYSSSSNTITGNTAFSNNYGGIYIESSSNNDITGNTLSNNAWEGVALSLSSNNNITGNTLSNNAWAGVALYLSSNNNITGNTLSNNSWWGIGLYPSSSDNTIKDNTVTGNIKYGIYLDSSSSNTIYNNYFNNTKNSNFTGTNNNDWNTSKTADTNIGGGPYLGGNFWAKPDGTGFSETCMDGDGDGICDSSYTLASGNVDYLPLKYLPVHNLNMNLSYSTIQKAIDAAETLDGHTIQVDAGTYTENVNVNKSLNIIGDGADVVTVNANDSSYHVFEVIADWVNITGFMVTGATGSGKAGVYVGGVNHSNITNINTSYNNRGIHLYNSSSNTIADNTIYNTTNTGIAIESYSDSNNIQDNDITKYCTGVAVYNSSFNVILDNIIQNSTCGGSGVDVYGGGGSNNTISGNTIRWNGYGVYLAYEDLTVVEGNNITDSNYGVYLSDSPNNTISSNIILDNTWGAYLNGSSNNTGNLIYNNYFFNTNNSYDNGTNDWNTTNSAGPNIAGGPNLGGNLWSDYIGDDNNGDGFGDTPYNISGGSGIDYLPLNDTKSPDITINFPQNNTAYDTHSIDFDIMVSEPIDANAGVIVYYLDVNTAPLQIPLEEDPQDQYHWYNDTVTLSDYGYGEGQYNATFNVTDLSGNSNSSTVYFSVDTTPPNVAIYSPGNNTYPTYSVDLNYTVNDSGEIDWVGYSLDGTANKTLSGNTTLKNLTDEDHILILYSNDTAGNIGSDTIWFSIDTTPPDITINLPLNTTYNTTNIVFDITTSEAIDANAGVLVYNIDGNAGPLYVQLISDTSTHWYNDTVSLLSDGRYNATFQVKDFVGNYNSSTVWFSIDTTPPLIENVSHSSVAKTSATITWDTDEDADSLVLYGTQSESYSHNGTNNNSMVKSHNITLTGLTAGTKYYYVVNSTDAVGNSNQSDERSFTTKSSGTSGSSSGGGGGGGGSSCNTFTFTKINQGESTTAHFTGDDCKGFPTISIISKENLSYVKLTLNLYDKKPWNTMPDPPKEAYSYLYLRFSKPDTYIEKGVVEFSINTTWLKDNDIDPYSVSIYRFVDNNWDEIETSPIIDNGMDIIFSAVTPGFSYFSIGGEIDSGYKSLVEEEVVSPTPVEEETIEPPKVEMPTPAPPVETPKPEQEQVKAPEENGGICGPTTVLLISMLCLLLFRDMRLKRN